MFVYKTFVGTEMKERYMGSCSVMKGIWDKLLVSEKKFDNTLLREYDSLISEVGRRRYKHS